MTRRLVQRGIMRMGSVRFAHGDDLADRSGRVAICNRVTREYNLLPITGFACYGLLLQNTIE